MDEQHNIEWKEGWREYYLKWVCTFENKLSIWKEGNLPKGFHIERLKQETNKLESNYQQKLTNLEELKKSILQKAFAGELTKKEVEV